MHVHGVICMHGVKCMYMEYTNTSQAARGMRVCNLHVHVRVQVQV